MAGMEKYIPKEYFWRNRVIMPVAIRVIGIPLVILKNAHCKRYRPRNKTFLLIANHNDILDPGYEMVSLMRYVRFVSSDHVVRAGFKGRFLNFFGTPIIKYHDHPREELTQNILATLRAGVSVGIHAEGGMSFNGESRYISPNTAKLIKDADCAVITYRSVGGYMRTPRWKRHSRKGPLYGEVVREYDREEIRNMTQDEVYDMICRDVHVNAYEEQRKTPRNYTGEALAECCEIVLYQCPACRQMGTLHSRGDFLTCDCGYSVKMEPDGFFHACGQDVIFDNICDWDHWQREALQEYLETFRNTPDKPAFRDEDQILIKMENQTGHQLSSHAVLELYYDRLVLSWETGERSVPLSSIQRMDYAKWQAILLVTDEDYFEINADIPRSTLKYMDAWRYLTGKPNY